MAKHPTTRQRFLDLARPLVGSPTAPFHEHYPLEVIGQFVQQRPALGVDRDEHGNLLLLYNGTRKRGQPRLILTAHLDHPALLWHEQLAAKQHLFGLYGGVNPALLSGASVRIYQRERSRTQRPLKGRIVQVDVPAQGRTSALIETQRPLPAQPQIDTTFATWDLPAWRQRGHRLHALACDDLAGAAVGLCFLDALLQRGAKTRAGLLLTRAEEVGFVGILAALQSGLLDPDALYINIECSSIKAGAAMGNGPVVRVGDRLRIFDPGISATLAACADLLKSQRKGFAYQRRLMDAGACEATPLVQAGLQTGAVALPLGNYHNIGEKKLEPECIHIEDACSLVELLVFMAEMDGGPAQALRAAWQALDGDLNRRLQGLRPLLAATA